MDVIKREDKTKNLGRNGTNSELFVTAIAVL